ncbi:response regulator transcription factor [Methylobacterium sp. 10]|uniref:helix-turn-helix transcriptional regulator n=1 Tax=Methylobacterium sp. 10 TaxID=1101191 RepID=UPI0018CC59F6|nr:response regulator transcription factor [Methylobacterium sp. 10]
MIHVSGTTFPRLNFAPAKRPAIVISGGTALYREGLRYILIKSGFDVVSMVGSLDQVQDFNETFESNLIIIMSLQPKADAPTEDILGARLRFPHSFIICICATCEAEHVAPMLESGAAAILLSSAGSDTLVQALELILLDHCVVPHLSIRANVKTEPCQEEDQAPASTSEDRPPSDDQAFHLSERELSIIACLIKGDSNRAIAERLAIAEGRVKGNVKSILRKINVRNRTQAALWGIKYCNAGDRTRLVVHHPGVASLNDVLEGMAAV